MESELANKSEGRRIFECLSPLVFPALAFLIGVFLSLFVPGGGWWGLATKLLMFCYSLLGWAIAVCFVQQKRLWCGGTQTISGDQWPIFSRRYGCGLGIVVSGFVLSTIGIFGASSAKNLGIPPVYGFMVYFFALPITFSILVGEIGWENPLKFFQMFGKVMKK